MLEGDITNDMDDAGVGLLNNPELFPQGETDVKSCESTRHQRYYCITLLLFQSLSSLDLIAFSFFVVHKSLYMYNLHNLFYFICVLFIL